MEPKQLEQREQQQIASRWWRAGIVLVPAGLSVPWSGIAVKSALLGFCATASVVAGVRALFVGLMLMLSGRWM